MVRDFRKLDIWRRSMNFLDRIYEVTSRFPKEEIYVLTSQMRRAVISIASNISEGCGKKTNKDFTRYLYNSMGSIKEVECQVEIADKLNYLKDGEKDGLVGELDEMGKMLRGFIKCVSEDIKD